MPDVRPMSNETVRAHGEGIRRVMAGENVNERTSDAIEPEWRVFAVAFAVVFSASVMAVTAALWADVSWTARGAVVCLVGAAWAVLSLSSPSRDRLRAHGELTDEERRRIVETVERAVPSAALFSRDDVLVGQREWCGTATVMENGRGLICRKPSGHDGRHQDGAVYWDGPAWEGPRREDFVTGQQ